MSRINPFNYGKIPVKIYRYGREIKYNTKTKADKPEDIVFLMYPITFPDGFTVVCPITGHPNKWEHMRISRFQFKMHVLRKRFVIVMDVGEAERYLNKYCKHFQLNPSNFILCSHIKELGHFSLREDGVDECPCKKDFTL